jgi:hypothetical protein
MNDPDRLRGWMALGLGEGREQGPEEPLAVANDKPHPRFLVLQKSLASAAPPHSGSV